MGIEIHYKASVEKDLRKIPRDVGRKLVIKFERAMISGSKSGEILKGEFTGQYKFRINNYRIIYTKIAAGILVLRISHRKESYRQALLS